MKLIDSFINTNRTRSCNLQDLKNSEEVFTLIIKIDLELQIIIVQKNVTFHPSYKWKNWLEIPRWKPTFSYKHQYMKYVFFRKCQTHQNQCTLFLTETLNVSSKLRVQCKNFSYLYPKAVIAIHSQEHSPTYRTSNCVFTENNTKNIMILNTYL